MTDTALIDTAQRLTGRFAPGEDCSAGSVAAALVTASGRLFTGICIDTACSLGFCAEHAAIAEMLKARESWIRTIVAVSEDGRVLPPCGRCRELIWQVDPRNRSTRVIVSRDRALALEDLLPRPDGSADRHARGRDLPHA